MSANEIRQIAFSVLLYRFPQKLSAREIADAICLDYCFEVSRQQVHSALRVFARSNKHFAIFPSFFPYRIKYSVYPFEGPYIE